jgi:predicted ester cyclase
MKKFIFIPAFALVCLIYGCNTHGSTDTGTGGTDTAYINKIKDFNVAVYKGFSNSDLSIFDTAHFTPDVTDHSMGPKDVVGLDSVKASLSKMFSQMKDLKFDIISQSVDGDVSMIWSRMRGTSTSPASGFATGTPIDMLSVDVLKFKDGKVSEHWGYMDPNDMMKMMPPSPPKMPMMDSAMKKMK